MSGGFGSDSVDNEFESADAPGGRVPPEQDTVGIEAEEDEGRSDESESSSGSESVESPVNHGIDGSYVMFRENASDWRGSNSGASGSSARLDLFPETAEMLDELAETHIDDVYSDVKLHKRDVTEAAIRVACQHPELVEQELDRWGCKTAQRIQED